MTLSEHRGKGLASAVVLRAAAAAREAGADFVFLVADSDDWPQKLYERLGFDPIGRGYARYLRRVDDGERGRRGRRRRRTHVRTIALLLCVAALGAACGSSGGESGARGTGPSTGDRPPPDEPSAGAGVRPPAAWIATRRGSHWLDFGSYCWRQGGRGVCADAAAPSCTGLHSAGRVVVDRGESVRFHLLFDPQEVAITLPTEQKLETSRTPSWTVEHPGVFSIFARPQGGGDASYTGCIVIAGP